MTVKFARNENMTIPQLQKENEKLKSEHAQLMEKVKLIDRKVVGLLWLLWFIPIIGWVIYTMIFSKRKQSEEYLRLVIPIKEHIAMNEIQIMQNNIWIEKKEANK